MARVMRIVSDLSGEDNAKEIEFYVDGKKYVIALTNREAYNFERTYKSAMARLAKYVEVVEVAKEENSKTLSTTFHVRNWAKAKGYNVPDRGVLPAWVWESWRKAGSPMSAEM